MANVLSEPPDVNTHVHNVYESIAKSFDKTRYNQWRYVKSYLSALPHFSIVGDVGCGNGKYLTVEDRTDLTMIGIDMCSSLLSIAQQKYPQTNLIRANATTLPYASSSLDAVISVAVLHHMTTTEARRRFVSEIIRSLRRGGTALIVVWAKEQTIKKTWKHLSGNDYMVPWKSGLNEAVDRYYHLFDEKELIETISSCPDTCIKDMHYEMDNWCVILGRHQ